MKNELKIQLLQQRRFICRHVLFHKTLTKGSAIELDINNYNTTDTINHLQASIDAYKYSFVPRAIRCWNLIPKKTRAIEMPETLRKEITSLFEEKYFLMTSLRGIYNRPILGKRTKESGNY